MSAAVPLVLSAVRTLDGGVPRVLRTIASTTIETLVDANGVTNPPNENEHMKKTTEKPSRCKHSKWNTEMNGYIRRCVKCGHIQRYVSKGPPNTWKGWIADE
jgi:hypothetical protein